MLSFYTLDLTNIIIILTCMFISYKLLKKDTPENNDVLLLVISGIIGGCLSILFSYMTLENDTILTSNFWD